jgi:hypothetical protein
MRVPLHDGDPTSAGGLMTVLKRQLPQLSEQEILERALNALVMELGHSPCARR